MFHSSTNRNRNFVEEDNCFQSQPKFHFKNSCKCLSLGEKEIRRKSARGNWRARSPICLRHLLRPGAASRSVGRRRLATVRPGGASSLSSPPPPPPPGRTIVGRWYARRTTHAGAIPTPKRKGEHTSGVNVFQTPAYTWKQ